MTQTDLFPAVGRYARIAPRYDRLHERWLRFAGGHAQCAFEGAVTALVRPGDRILDVGCGTGALARRLKSRFGEAIELTLVDACREMLDATNGVRARRYLGTMETLPVPSLRYDLITCSWALETASDVAVAIREMFRLARPGGAICLAFCANVTKPGPAGQLLKAAVWLRRRVAFSIRIASRRRSQPCRRRRLFACPAAARPQST